MPTLDEIMLEATRDGRVCPQPVQWHRLWEMLPGRQRKGLGWEPPAPLILAAWWEATDEEKRERFLLHIRWAYNHGALDQVANLVLSLKPGDWYKGT